MNNNLSRNKNMEEKDVCYICLHGEDDKENGEFVIACGQCRKSVHMECIQKQVDHELMECGNCKKKIGVNLEYEEFDTEEFIDDTKNVCKYTGYILWYIFYTGHVIAVSILLLGKSVIDPKFSNFGTIFMTLVPFAALLQYPPYCMYYPKKCVVVCEGVCEWCDYRCYDADEDEETDTSCMNTWKSHVFIVCLMILELIIVGTSHAIGSPIIKWLYKKDEMFTWRTGLAGIICYYMAGAIVLITWLILSLIYRIKGGYTKKRRRVILVES